jgi:hypothetical protein
MSPTGAGIFKIGHPQAQHYTSKRLKYDEILQKSYWVQI